MFASFDFETFDPPIGYSAQYGACSPPSPSFAELIRSRLAESLFPFAGLSSTSNSSPSRLSTPIRPLHSIIRPLSFRSIGRKGYFDWAGQQGINQLVRPVARSFSFYLRSYFIRRLYVGSNLRVYNIFSLLSPASDSSSE